MELPELQVLVFSTNLISDVGIDSAGLMHFTYPATTTIIRLPCSSMLRPEWVLLAIKNGFDGVFVAADGSDCPYLKDCTERTAKRVDRAQRILKENGIEPERVKMAAICSVCAEPFANLIKDFIIGLEKIGTVRRER